MVKLAAALARDTVGLAIQFQIHDVLFSSM